ncbi:MAG: hypothetical protein JNL80_01220 [Phycisphaerae bacterium]|jgi:uncharacterized membrane protein|nr:hypothetical protein [Phycisphaerae bacterium]
MTKSQLILLSAVRDVLDFTPIGHIPVLDQLLDIPVIVAHFRYAGPRAFVVIPELMPLIGILPLYTLVALFYPAHPHE